MFSRVLVANRGEIALRVVRALREMGIESVVAYSQADKDTRAVQEADIAVCIGPAPSAKSYLNFAAVIGAAVSRGCQAVHPGYGFLSENSDFARACADNDLVFIGPSADVIDRMGEKSNAKQTMIAAGVPCVPGSAGEVETLEEAFKVADEIGYPLLVKASAGGGGKGMREAWNAEELEKAYTTARSEARVAFGNDAVYMERLVQHPRHVEVQVLADNFGNAIHLCERDCSVQRRHQKLVEEGPSPALTPELRQQMGDAAVRAVRQVGYTNAGTIEFLLDSDGRFYFMEMNTRIQVEHLTPRAATPSSSASTPRTPSMASVRAPAPSRSSCCPAAPACASTRMPIRATRSRPPTTRLSPSLSCGAATATRHWPVLAAPCPSSSSRASRRRFRSTWPPFRSPLSRKGPCTRTSLRRICLNSSSSFVRRAFQPVLGL